MKTFCIAGPVNPEEHYFIAHRMDKKDHIYQLIAEKKYFILHAPRQYYFRSVYQKAVEQKDLSSYKAVRFCSDQYLGDVK